MFQEFLHEVIDTHTGLTLEALDIVLAFCHVTLQIDSIKEFKNNIMNFDKGHTNFFLPYCKAILQIATSFK